MKKVAKARKQERALPLLSQQVQECLEGCGQSRYAVSQATGIAQSVLSRFATGKTGLSGKALDVLGAYLRLEVKMHGVVESRK